MRALAIVVLTACGRIDFDPLSSCAYGPWSTPTHVDSASTPTAEYSPAISSDGRELYVEAAYGGNLDVFVRTRALPSDPFGPAMPIAAINTAVTDGEPTLSADGLSMYFASNRSGTFEIYRATRPALDAPFDTVVWLDQYAGRAVTGPVLSADGRELIVNDMSATTIYRAKYDDVSATFGALEPLTSLSIGVRVGFAALEPDARTIYFQVAIDATTDIYAATRDGFDQPFGTPVRVDELSVPNANDVDPYVSSDGREMYFASDRPGSVGANDLWVATRECL